MVCQTGFVAEVLATTLRRTSNKYQNPVGVVNNIFFGVEAGCLIVVGGMW